MKNLSYNILIIFSLFFCSCDNEEPEKKNEFPEYLIFGRFSGECTGELCVEIYKIQESMLYEAEDIYPTALMLHDGGLYEAEFIEINNLTEYGLEYLITNFPNELFNEESTDIGCPDCADQGGYFFEMSTKSSQDNWRVDMDRSAVPSYLISYLDLVDEKITVLRE